jgi:hypothetical protein
LLMATLLSTAIGTAISTGLKAGGEVAKSAVTVAGAGVAASASAATDANANDKTMAYFVDSLFRAPATATPVATQTGAPDRIPEVTRIFANALRSGELAESDRQYLGQLVATNTGLAPPEAEQRVNDAFARLKQDIEQAKAKAKQAADDARKASAALALWLVMSLFVGAFVASFAATFGGRLRDSSVLAKA